MGPQNTASRSSICEDASRNSGRQDNGIKPLTKKLGNEDEKSGEGFEPRQKKVGGNDPWEGQKQTQRGHQEIGRDG